MPITDSGSRVQKGTGSRILNTVSNSIFTVGLLFLDNWKTEDEFYGDEELLSPSNEENAITEGNANGSAKECVGCEGELAGYDEWEAV